MDNMINFIGFEREYFGKAASYLIKKKHREESLMASDRGIVVSSR